MIEILKRLYVGLFAAAIFSGLPAMFCLVLSVKVMHSRRTGVWTGKYGRRWTQADDPDRFEAYVKITTVMAVGFGIVAGLIAITMIVVCLQSPTGPPPTTLKLLAETVRLNV